MLILTLRTLRIFWQEIWRVAEFNLQTLRQTSINFFSLLLASWGRHEFYWKMQKRINISVGVSQKRPGPNQYSNFFHYTRIFSHKNHKFYKKSKLNYLNYIFQSAQVKSNDFRYEWPYEPLTLIHMLQKTSP